MAVPTPVQDGPGAIVAAIRVIADGSPMAGALGLAGEIGHVADRPGGEPCTCGQRGCAETYASAAAIARRYRDRTGHARSAEEILAASATDAAAREVWSDATD